MQLILEIGQNEAAQKSTIRGLRHGKQDWILVPGRQFVIERAVSGRVASGEQGRHVMLAKAPPTCRRRAAKNEEQEAGWVRK